MSRPKLLVIDDDPVIVELIAAVADKSGYEPLLATSFADYRAVYADDVAVITLDMVMLDCDGVEILRDLGKVRSQAELILISSVDRQILASAEHLAIERGLHVTASLAKPIDVDALWQLLSEARSDRRRQEPTPMTLLPEQLRTSIERDELSVLFQPKVDLGNRATTGFEAVMRLWHPELGPVDPATIVRLAEAEGLAMPLTERVVESAFEQLSGWCTENPSHRIAVNLSGQCLDDLGLPDYIAERARKHRIDPARVILELTESCLAEDPTSALDVATRLRLKGFQLSIDDFGTGIATLEQLKRMPFNELKLDRSFVHAMLADTDARRIVESTISLGHSLGLRVVGEGIETASQWQFLAEQGCDVGQGFYIGVPMRADDLAGWLQAWQAA